VDGGIFARRGEGWVREQVPPRNLLEPRKHDVSTVPG
jgi:hypothetical protein